MTFYSVSAVIGYAAGYKRLKKYNNNNNNNNKNVHENSVGYKRPRTIYVCDAGTTLIQHHGDCWEIACSQDVLKCAQNNNTRNLGQS